MRGCSLQPSDLQSELYFSMEGAYTEFDIVKLNENKKRLPVSEVAWTRRVGV